MGTEQENEGLNDEFDADAIFKAVYEASLKGTQPDFGKIEKQPEESPVAETPAEPQKEEEPPVAATEAAKEPEKDPLADLPEDVRNRILALEKAAEERAREAAEWKQKYKSDEGRVAAFQRRAQELERKLQEKPKQQEQAKPESIKLKVEESEEWRALSESDPVLAKLWKNSLEEVARQAKEQAVSEARAAIKPLYEERELEYHSREEQKLRQMVPNLDEVVQSDVYADWYSRQPKSIQDMANSSADEAFRVLKMYAMDMQERYGAPVETQPAPVQPTAAATPATTAKIQQERERKLQSQGVGGKVTATPNELSDEEIFKRAYNSNLSKR